LVLKKYGGLGLETQSLGLDKKVLVLVLKKYGGLGLETQSLGLDKKVLFTSLKNDTYLLIQQQ